MKSSFTERISSLREKHTHLSYGQAFDIILNERILEEQIRIDMMIDHWFDLEAHKSILDFFEYTGFLIKNVDQMMGIPSSLLPQQCA